MIGSESFGIQASQRALFNWIVRADLRRGAAGEIRSEFGSYLSNGAFAISTIHHARITVLQTFSGYSTAQNAFTLRATCRDMI